MTTVIKLARDVTHGPNKTVIAKIIAKLTEMDAFLGSWIANESAINISSINRATSNQGSAGFIIRLTTRVANAAKYML